MTFYFPNTDPAYIYKRAGTTTDPYLFLHETAQVANGIVVLKEIPAFANKVITKKLDGTTLTEVTTDTLQSNQFRVDYSTGIVYLHSSLESTTLTFDFYGTGYVSFPASRVWVDTNTNDSNKTIQQLFADMDNLKTNWLVAVNTYSAIATTYPTPKLGDTVQTTDDSRIYRFNGDAWVNTQQYTENAITNFQNRLDSLSKVSNEYEWTATAGQVVYILPSGSNLDDQWLEVFVGGALVSPSLIRKDSQTQFTLLVDPSKIPAGVIVSARWVEGYVAATIGHHNTHELGGNDEIDVTHLKNYNEQIGTPIANLSKAPSEYEWTATAGQLTYVLPSGQTYDTTSKWLQVSIGGAVIADSLIQKDSSTQFTLLVSSSNIPAGITVMARWVTPYIPATSGHHTTHEVGGYDEIDVTKLRNYQEQIALPLADNAKQITDRIISAKDKQFGAKGDGVTDDTAALQAFFTYVVNNHLEGKIPAGTYLISNEITIPSMWGWKISGAGVAATTIKQNNDNTPIFHFLSTPSYAHSIQLKGMSFDYTNSQLSSNTNSYPIKLETMVYESTFDELGFNNGTYGIYVTDATQNPWGCTFDNLRFNSGMTMGAIRMSALNAVPNNRYGRIFCSCQNMIGPVFNLKGYNSVIDAIEFIAANQGAKLMTFQAGSVFEIKTLKLENGIYNSAQNLFEFSTSSQIRIGSITIGGNQNMTINPSTGSVYVLKSIGSAPSAKITLGYISLGGTSIANAYAFGSLGYTTLQTIDIPTAGWALTNVGSDTGCETLIVKDYFNDHLAGDKGDANYTISLGDPNTFQFNTVLTAPRTITLPSDGTKLFNGLKYRCVIGNNVVTNTNTLAFVSSSQTYFTATTGNIIVEFTWMRKDPAHAYANWVMTKCYTSDVMDNLSGLVPLTKSPMSVTASGTGVFNGSITAPQHGIQINSPSLNKMAILQSNINATNYGILLNTNSDSGENLLIALNTIYSQTADAIELNNPSTTPFKNVRVIANELTADNVGSAVNSGFALGIAKTRNVTAIGNISNLSRAEGLHIEDDQENITVIGNVFDQCQADGARIINNFGSAHPVKVIGNHFVKANLDKTSNGIWRVYGGSGTVDCDLSHNRVRGFNIGLWMDGKAFSNVEGCTVEDCNIGIKTGDVSIIRGTIFTINTPTLVQGGSGAVIDKVVSKTVPTTILQYTGTAGQEGATLKGFTAKSTYTSTAGVANTIDLFPLPSLMTGKIKITRSGADKIYCVADVVWDGTTLTVSNMLKKNAGVIGSTFTLVNNNGKLAITVSNIANVQTFDLFYDFDGVYYQE